MTSTRIIARLDVKGKNLIKRVHLEGLRVVGDPQLHAENYYQDGADELLYMDTVASLYGRNNLSNIVERTAENVFIPITVGGGIRSVADVRKLMSCGADKVALNTAAIENPYLISEIASVFGVQSIVLSVEASRKPDGGWWVYTSNGRDKSEYELLEWLNKAVELGAGEILLTSIDNEGTNKGFDLDLVSVAHQALNVPIIASGGMGRVEDIMHAVSAGADAIATADLIHYGKIKISEMKHAQNPKFVKVRL